jgi:hypothetical protein
MQSRGSAEESSQISAPNVESASIRSISARARLTADFTQQIRAMTEAQPWKSTLLPQTSKGQTLTRRRRR